MDNGGDWINSDFHWDNIFSSIFNLFIIATCEGWSAFMYELNEAKGINLFPEKNYNKWWFLYTLIYFFTANLMVFNTFIGVLTE